MVIPLEYDGAGYIGGGENDTVRLCWVQKGDSYGIFENPYYVAPEETPGTEQGNTEESPAPGSDSPGGQETANPGNTENTADSGGGFPVVPVVIAVVVVVVAAVVAALALKKKNPAPTAPHGKPTQEVKPEQAQSFKFCPKCGTKVPMDTNFCPKCGKQLESGEG